MGQCYYCGMEINTPVYRNTVCPSCGKDLKICFNCRFYSPGSHWDCNETIREAVRDKERANFCDFFQLGSGHPGDTDRKKSSEKSKNAFNKLFGD